MEIYHAFQKEKCGKNPFLVVTQANENDHWTNVDSKELSLTMTLTLGPDCFDNKRLACFSPISYTMP